MSSELAATQSSVYRRIHHVLVSAASPQRIDACTQTSLCASGSERECRGGSSHAREVSPDVTVDRPCRKHPPTPRQPSRANVSVPPRA